MEILADYGNAYWWARSQQSSHYSRRPTPIPIRCQAVSHPQVATSGKALSSDPIGDGPGHDRSTTWVYLLGTGYTHTHRGAYTVIRADQQAGVNH